MFASMQILRHSAGSMASFLRELTLKNFHPESKQYPQLKGKAVQVRACTEILLKLWLEIHDDSKCDRLLKLALLRSKSFDDIIRSNTNVPVLSEMEAKKLKKVTIEFLSLYIQLKEEWQDHGSYFLATKKFHDLYHLAERSAEVNPAITSCMMLEDLMGKVKTLMIKCTQANRPSMASLKAMRKYMLGLHIEYTQ